MQATENRDGHDLSNRADGTAERGVLLEREMGTEAIVQRDDRTPMGPRSASFFIRGIHGPVA